MSEHAGPTPAAQARKALYAFGAPLVLTIGGSMLDGDLTRGELIVALGTALVTGVGVYKVPNADAE